MQHLSLLCASTATFNINPVPTSLTLLSLVLCPLWTLWSYLLKKGDNYHKGTPVLIISESAPCLLLLSICSCAPNARDTEPISHARVQQFRTKKRIRTQRSCCSSSPMSAILSCIVGELNGSFTLGSKHAPKKRVCILYMCVFEFLILIEPHLKD